MPGELFDDRNYAGQFFRLGYGGCSGAGGFAADIEEIRPFRGERQRVALARALVLRAALAREPPAAARKFRRGAFSGEANARFPQFGLREGRDEALYQSEMGVLREARAEGGVQFLLCIDQQYLCSKVETA